MTTKLTKRDKILIYVMVIVLIVFGFVMLLLIPQMERGAALDTEIATLEAEKMPIEAAVMGLPGMRTTVETTREKLGEALNAFYPHMENYAIDKMLTNLLIGSYGLGIDSFDIDAVPKAVMVPVYGGERTFSGSTESSAAEEEVAADKVPLLTSQVTIGATGSRESFQRLVDDLFQSYPSIRVTGYSVGEDSQNEEGAFVMSLYLDVYMQRPKDEEILVAQADTATEPETEQPAA